MGLAISLEKHDNPHTELVYHCKNGYIDKLHYLYLENPELDISANNEEAFRAGCESGDVYVIRLLREWKPDINIGANEHEGLRLAISYGFIDIIRQIIDWDRTIVPNQLLPYAIHTRTIEILIALQEERDSTRWLNTPLEIKTDCPICQETVEQCIQTPCCHRYCQPCIIRWYQYNPSCPYCRKILYQGNIYGI